MSETPAIRIVPVDEGNRAACLALEVAPSQRAYIADNARSLEQAAGNPALRPELILRGEDPVGFVLHEPRGEVVVAIHRFMIDRGFQQRGIGTEALRMLLDRFDAQGRATVYLSFRPENLVARAFFESHGFVEQEIEADGEVLQRRGPLVELE